MNSMQAKRHDKCIHCKDSQASPSFFPFCSERCKLLDLGAWATERYKISSESCAEDGDSAGADESTSSHAEIKQRVQRDRRG